MWTGSQGDVHSYLLHFSTVDIEYIYINTDLSAAKHKRSSFLTQAWSNQQGVGSILLHVVMQEPRLPKVRPSSALASKVTLSIHIQMKKSQGHTEF